MATGTASEQLRGEIDNSSTGQVAGLATVIILDVSGGSFPRAAGLTALLRLAARLDMAGCHLVLAGPHHHPVLLPIEIASSPPFSAVVRTRRQDQKNHRSDSVAMDWIAPRRGIRETTGVRNPVQR